MVNFFNAEKEKVQLTTSIKLSKQGKRVIGIIIACLVFVVGIFAANKLGLLKNSGKQAYEIESENTERYIKNPEVGDICQVIISNRQDPASSTYTLFKVIGVDKVNNKVVTIPLM